MDVRRLVGLVTCLGWIACLGSIALTLALPGVSGLAVVLWSPWLLGLLLLGISHGAFDHRVGAELRMRDGDRPGAVAEPGFYAAYLTAVLAVLALWFASPIVASAGFLAAFWEFQKGALPMTCESLAVASSLGFVVGRTRMSVVDLGALARVALSALTLPHVLVVARQGVWSTRPGRTP